MSAVLVEARSLVAAAHGDIERQLAEEERRLLAARERLESVRAETARLQHETEWVISEGLRAAERVASRREPRAAPPPAAATPRPSRPGRRRADGPGRRRAVVEPRAKRSERPRRSAALWNATLVVSVVVAAVAGTSYRQTERELANARLCSGQPLLSEAAVRADLARLGKGEARPATVGSSTSTSPAAAGTSTSREALAALDITAAASGEVAVTATALREAHRSLVAMEQAALAVADAGASWEASPTAAELVDLRDRLLAADGAFRAACMRLAR